MNLWFAVLFGSKGHILDPKEHTDDTHLSHETLKPRKYEEEGLNPIPSIPETKPSMLTFQKPSSSSMTLISDLSPSIPLNSLLVLSTSALAFSTIVLCGEMRGE